jgi:uncharacterized protein (TIGR02246 family)
MVRRQTTNVPVVVAAVVLASAILGAQANGDSASTDVENIRQVSAAIDSAFVTGDAAAMAALVTEDAVWMPPEESTITGRAAIQKRYTKLFSELRSRFENVSHSLEVDEVRVCGDWAISRGRYRLELTLVNVPRTVVITGKNVHTYQRLSDGSWLITSDIWNTDAPVHRSPEQ